MYKLAGWSISTLERVAYLVRKDERLDVLHFRDTGQLFIGRDISGVVAECKTIHTWDWNHIRRIGINYSQVSELICLCGSLVYSL